MCYTSVSSFRIRLLSVLLLLAPASFVFGRASVKPVVEAEEIVTRYVGANNGAGPMWCYGSTCIARDGDDVYASVIETGKDVPLLCNTRWQLWHRSNDGWKLAQTEPQYRQREPCPIATLDGGVFLSVNPSTEPPGTKYGPCKPLVLEFDCEDPAKPFETHHPTWADGYNFTDHSYRGFAADRDSGQLLLMNVHSATGEQYISWRDSRGTWHAKGKIKFPIRSCYPQVALKNKAAHVMAIGDIVEPVEKWRKLKFEVRKSKWDYVFRRLFYASTPDITSQTFAEPIEVDTVDDTAGHITNLDLYIGPAGAAHLLYLKRPHQYKFIRDKYFPNEPMTVYLQYVTIADGKILSRRTLIEASPDKKGLHPAFARLHVTPDGRIYAIIAATDTKTGNFANYLLDTTTDSPPTPIELKHPFHNFFTNTTRAGSKPSNTIDLFGTANDNPNLRYSRIQLKQPVR